MKNRSRHFLKSMRAEAPGPYTSREAPVRVWHWLMAVAMFAMIITGYLIGRPLVSNLGDTWITYDFGYVRMVHFAAGLFFTALFIYRLFWVAVGNRYARMIFFPPLLSMKWWKGVFAQVAYYLFMRKSAPEYAGHNPLAQLAMFAMFVLGSFVIIITGPTRALRAVLGLGHELDGLVRLGVRPLRRRPGGPHGAPRDDVRVHPLQHRPYLHELPRRRHGRRHHASPR